MKEVTAAVIIRDKKVLLTRRGPHSKLAGYWEFPGGKVETGETRQACLERELKEELGMHAEAGDEIARSEYHYEHGSFQIIAIEATMIGKEFVLKEHDLAAWVPVDELSNYKLAPADIPLVQAIRAKYE